MAVVESNETGKVYDAIGNSGNRALGIIGTILGGMALVGGSLWGRNSGFGFGPAGYGNPPMGQPGAQPVFQTPPKLVTQEQMDSAKENARLDAENKLLQAKLFAQEQIRPLAINDAKNEEALKYQQKEIERLYDQLGKVATFSVPIADVSVPFSTATKAGA